MPALENPLHEKYCQLAAVDSYANAFRATYGQGQRTVKTMNTEIWRLNGRADISRRITEIQAAAAAPLNATREWLLAWWFGRMMYDPAEITAWAIDACRHCHGDNFGYQWTLAEFDRACADAEMTKAPLPDIGGGFGFDPRRGPNPDCPECHGRGRGRSDIADTRELSPAARAAFEGIKETRNGIEIKMADKGQAAEQFAKLSGFDIAQVRLLTDPIPSDAELDRLSLDPVAIAAAYKRFVNGGAMH